MQESPLQAVSTLQGGFFMSVYRVMRVRSGESKQAKSNIFFLLMKNKRDQVNQRNAAFERGKQKRGRITLNEMRFITTSKNGERQEQILTSQTEYDAVLREHFGIVMAS